METEGTVYVAPCLLGRGVFAARQIEAGEVILRFEGRLMTRQEAAAKGERTMDAFQVAPDLFVDLDPPGLFLNHSCDPNALVRDDVILVARRRIPAGEEIRYDYSTTMGDDLETMACRCSGRGCRGIVEDFHRLPENIRRGYVAEGAVQSFIAHDHRVRGMWAVPPAPGRSRSMRRPIPSA